jgi:mRNA interferase RelE/StbE
MDNNQTGNESVTWKIFLTPTSRVMFASIQDERVRKKIAERIDGLADNPNIQGKPLISELKTYRSLRAVGQRYRIIYRLDNDKVIVTVVAVGLRKEGDKADVYTLAKKLLKLGLLE